MLTADEVLKAARSLSGQPIKTITGRATFTVHLEGDSIIYTPATGQPRRQPRKKLEELLKIYNETGAMTCPPYHEATFNASYFLGLIQTVKSGP